MREKVFGIGLNKTGTRTLGACLRELGYRHREHRPGSRRRMLAAYRDGNLSEMLSEIEQFDSFEDWPYPLAYQELFDRYGHCAKFVLTTSLTAEHWLESLKRHSLRTSPTAHCRKLAYGYDYPHGREREHLAIYEAHNREVVAYFEEKGAADKLVELCWQRGDGWRELCGFLEKPIPSNPFPWLNASERGPAAANPERTIENTRLAALDVGASKSSD